MLSAWSIPRRDAKCSRNQHVYPSCSYLYSLKYPREKVGQKLVGLKDYVALIAHVDSVPEEFEVGNMWRKSLSY